MRTIIVLYAIFALLLSSPLRVVGADKSESEFSLSEKNLLRKIVFFGDSTTYHLIAREILPEGKSTTQVWCPKNGTLLLSPAVASFLISHPHHDAEIFLKDALSLYKPEYFVITAGLNGAHAFTEERFKCAYTALIELVRATSPETEMLLQSVFPVGENASAWTTVTPEELNRRIDRINVWIRDLAEKHSLCFLNTQEVLRNNDGFLRKEFQVGDGIHISTEGYRAILTYILSSLMLPEEKYAS